jgi:hypothetical protein
VGAVGLVVRSVGERIRGRAGGVCPGIEATRMASKRWSAFSRRKCEKACGSQGIFPHMYGHTERLSLEGYSWGVIFCQVTFVRLALDCHSYCPFGCVSPGLGEQVNGQVNGQVGGQAYELPDEQQDGRMCEYTNEQVGRRVSIQVEILVGGSARGGPKSRSRGGDLLGWLARGVGPGHGAGMSLLLLLLPTLASSLLLVGGRVSRQTIRRADGQTTEWSYGQAREQNE